MSCAPASSKLRMTGYDVLKRVQMPAKTDPRPLRVPVALREDGAVHYRDYRAVPHALTLGATESGQVRLPAQPGRRARPAWTSPWSASTASRASNCSRWPAGSPRWPTTRTPPPNCSKRSWPTWRTSTSSSAPSSGSASDVPDAEIAADIWDLPDDLRPMPVVVLVDEVAELALFATKEEEKRRDRIITALVRLAQLGRAAGIYLEICGQRFGSELGKGITMLRAQLTGRTAHRVNDETSANMAFGDISPDAVLAAIQIPAEPPASPIAGDSTGGWPASAPRTPRCAQAVNICNRHADRTPDLPALAAVPARRSPPPPSTPAVPLAKASPATA